jgi:lipopolysaccharide export system protein LptC
MIAPALPKLDIPTPGRRRGLALVLRLWDRLTIYLPLLVTGLLALVTYWLVSSAPPAPAPVLERAAKHEVDYFMRRATVKTFDETGRLKSEIFGLEARHYPDTETVEIDQFKMRAINPQGRITTATATRALSNDAGNEVQLFGNARVVREPLQQADGSWLPRQEYLGEFLHVFVDEERIKSHLPVVLTSGKDTFSGNTLAHDSVTQVTDLQGRVKARLEPRRSTTPAPTR